MDAVLPVVGVLLLLAAVGGFVAWWARAAAAQPANLAPPLTQWLQDGRPRVPFTPSTLDLVAETREIEEAIRGR